MNKSDRIIALKKTRKEWSMSAFINAGFLMFTSFGGIGFFQILMLIFFWVAVEVRNLADREINKLEKELP